MFYTIVNNNLITANNKEILEKYYDTEILELPADYVQDKYIVVNGELVLNPDYEKEKEQAERERIAMLSLTKREVFLALYKDKGLTPEDIRNQIQDVSALIEFDYATEYFRGNPLIDSIGAMLGYTSEQLDYLFENKELA